VCCLGLPLGLNIRDPAADRTRVALTSDALSAGRARSGPRLRSAYIAVGCVASLVYVALPRTVSAQALFVVIALSVPAVGFVGRRRVDGARTVKLTLANEMGTPAVNGWVITAHDVTDEARLTAELRHQSLHDTLTGQPNRALLFDRIQHSLDRMGRHRRLQSRERQPGSRDR
jgi:hypothetical protein